MLFPHCCVWIRSSLDKVFPVTELRPFFSNTCSMSLYQLLVFVGILQTILRKKQRNGHLEAQDSFLQTRTSVKQFKEAFCTSNTCSGSNRGSDRYSGVKLSIAIVCELIDSRMTAAFTGNQYQLGEKTKQGFNIDLVGLWNVSVYLLANYEGVGSLKEGQLRNQTFFHQEWATEKVGAGKSCVAIIAGSEPRSKSSFEK